MLMKPMLAKDGDPSALTFPVVVQPKLDGVRALVQRDEDGEPVLTSRSLKLIPNAEIRASLERDEFVGLDGELIVGDPTADDAYRRTTSFVMSESKTGEPWAFHVFDKFDAEGDPSDRLHAAAVVTARFPSVLKLVESCYALDEVDLLEVEQRCIANGYEGVIVRVPGSAYKHGRSGKTGPLLKIKRFVDFEAEVIGVYEKMHNANEAFTNELGRTARSTAKAGLVGTGTLGGLILRAVNGPWEGVEFRCGTGFDAAQRADLWRTDVDDVIGRTAKVKSFEIGAKDKPRFPVWLGWRDLSVDG